MSRSQGVCGLAEEVVVTTPCSSMEEIVLADQENSRELLIVICHHNILGWSLAEVEKSVDILNTSKTLLP